MTQTSAGTSIMELGDLIQEFRFTVTVRNCKMTKKSSAVNILKVKISTILPDDNDIIDGNEMVRLSEKLTDCLGVEQLEKMMDHKESIPVEWRKYYIIFPATEWTDELCKKYIPCIFYNGADYQAIMLRLNDKFNSSFVFAREG